MVENLAYQKQFSWCVRLTNCSRNSISVKNMFLQFFIMMSVSSLVTANCKFPKYLKADALWTANYQNDGSFRGYFQEDNQGSFLKASRCTKLDKGEACVVFRRKCLSRIPNTDKYEVQHISSDSEETMYYMCMQFIRRSKSILQLKESQKLVYRSSSLCNDENLTLDHWPLVTDEEFFDQKELCPFSGGYNLRFHTSGRDPICPQEIIPPRIESECEPGDGLTINFRHRECIIGELNMELEMKLHCVAHWTHDRFTFVILKPQKNNDFKAWCLRLTGTGPNMKIEHGYLFTDFVCDPGDGNGNIRLTSNYLYIEFKLHVVSSMCVDLANICEERRLCRHPPSRIHCPKSCGFCEGDPNPCSFPEDLRGEWVDATKDKKRFIDISYYSVTLTEAGTFQCFENEGHHFENDTMLLQTFDNGCFPRFACLQVNKPSSSTIEYRLGNRISWPVGDMNRENLKEVVCKDRQFKPSTKDKLLLGKQINEKPSKILVDSKDHQHHAVDCELSRWRGFSDAKLYAKGDDCDSCLYYNTTHPKNIIQHPWNCSANENSHMIKREFRCLAVFPQDESKHAVLTRTLHHHQEYMCWVFLFESDGLNEIPVVYIIDASNCNQVAIEAVENGHLQPNKKLFMREPKTRKCPNIGHLLTTTTSSTTTLDDTFIPIEVFPTPRNPGSVAASGSSNGTGNVNLKFSLFGILLLFSLCYGLGLL